MIDSNLHVQTTMKWNRWYQPNCFMLFNAFV